MSWLRIATKLKLFKVGDILRNKSTEQTGVITNDYQKHYVLECSSAPDTPFKRETKTLSHQDASDQWARVGKIKLRNYMTDEQENVICEKTHKKGWLDFPMHKMGSQVSTKNDPGGLWIIVEDYGHNQYGIISAPDLNTHSAIAPVKVHAQDLSIWAVPNIKIGANLEDEYYGTGKVTDTSNYFEDGTIEVLFEDRFKVRNYKLPANFEREAVKDEPFIITRCGTDGSYHTPFCADHIESLEIQAISEEQEVLSRKATQVRTAPSPVEVTRQLQALLKGLELDMFAPSMYYAAKKTSTAIEMQDAPEIDIIHLASTVMHAHSKRTGIVVDANMKDWSVKVRWDDNGAESTCWRQELVKKAVRVDISSSHQALYPVIVTPDPGDGVGPHDIFEILMDEYGGHHVSSPTARGDNTTFARVRANSEQDAKERVAAVLAKAGIINVNINPQEQPNLPFSGPPAPPKGFV